MKNLYLALALIFISTVAFAQYPGTGYNTNLSIGLYKSAPLFDGEFVLSNDPDGESVGFNIAFHGDSTGTEAVTLRSMLEVPTDSVWYGSFETLGVSEGNAKSYFFESQSAVIRESSGTLTISLGSATNASDTIVNCTVTPKVDDTNKLVYVEVTGEASTDIKWVSVFRGLRIRYPE